MKPVNHKAWWLVLPVLVLVAFSALIPLMTVVNYSFQDTFGNNQFFWAGTVWYEQVLNSERFWNALGRSFAFSTIILAIEIPLGVFIALHMPRKGIGVAFCLVLMSLPLLIPWNVVGTIWQVFGRVDIGLLGGTLAAIGVDYNYVNSDALGGRVSADLWAMLTHDDPAEVQADNDDPYAYGGRVGWNADPYTFSPVCAGGGGAICARVLQCTALPCRRRIFCWTTVGR